MAEQRATEVLRRMAQFGNTLSSDDRRSMAKGLKMTTGTLEKLANARQLLSHHNDRMDEARAISLASWQLVPGRNGPFSKKSVRADIAHTSAEIDRLEAHINEDCAAMEGILADNNFAAR